MKHYRFRTNWRGKLILQRLYTWRGPYGDPECEWCDATVQDLKDYYAELCKLQTPCTCQEQRRLFDAECG
jgi:hypothetical protein